eukprot:6199975-Pleurochrysis_carterae.AAC.4
MEYVPVFNSVSSASQHAINALISAHMTLIQDSEPSKATDFEHLGFDPVAYEALEIDFENVRNAAT